MITEFSLFTAAHDQRLLTIPHWKSMASGTL